MSTPIHNLENDMSQIADHARDLLAATADATEEHVKEVRARLNAALNGGKTMLSRFRERASSGTQACDLAIHENPYLATGVAIGIGALFGYLMVRGCSNSRR